MPQVITNPHLYHGAFLLDSASKHCLIAEMALLLRARGRSLVARLAAAPVLDRTLSAARHLMHHYCRPSAAQLGNKHLCWPITIRIFIVWKCLELISYWSCL
jgi:hypothetical protein